MTTRSFPWLPIGMEAGRQAVGRVLAEGEGYQLCSARGSQERILLLRSGSRVFNSATRDLPEGLLSPVAFGDEAFLAAAFPEDAQPVRVADLPKRPGFLNGAELLRLADALADLEARHPGSCWEEALHFPREMLCLPTAAVSNEDRLALAVSLMTGGVRNSSLLPAEMHRINTAVSEGDAKAALSRLGLRGGKPSATIAIKGQFSLKGRPALEALFQEYVIDYFGRREAYGAMKVRPPNGILLYGPPGTGKTSAVRKLAEHLGWPVTTVNMGTVGSPFIHQTSVALKRAFDAAEAQAPSILVMEEIDAMVGTRGPGSQDHKVEEVAELLRQIETAGERGVLVIATTNRVDAIDPAMLRRGRFDHKIEVGLPSSEEIVDALTALLADRPTSEGLNLDGIARALKGRNMADVAWTVDEAARVAVKSGRTVIDDLCLREAVKKLG